MIILNAIIINTSLTSHAVHTTSLCVLIYTPIWLYVIEHNRLSAIRKREIRKRKIISWEKFVTEGNIIRTHQNQPPKNSKTF